MKVSSDSPKAHTDSIIISSIFRGVFKLTVATQNINLSPTVAFVTSHVILYHNLRGKRFVNGVSMYILFI